MGLGVGRPVLNIDQEACDRLWDEAEAAGIGRGLMVRLLSEESAIILLNTREIRRAQKVAGIDPTPEANDDLAADLEEMLPASTTEDLLIPTFPAAEGTPRNKRTRALFSIAAYDPRILAERQAAITAINEMYDIETVPAGSTGDNWYDTPYNGGVDAVSFRRDPAHLEIMRGLLVMKSAILPPDTELGPVSFDDLYE